MQAAMAAAVRALRSDGAAQGGLAPAAEQPAVTPLAGGVR
jgi:hypothetical protein